VAEKFCGYPQPIGEQYPAECPLRIQSQSANAREASKGISMKRLAVYGVVARVLLMTAGTLCDAQIVGRTVTIPRGNLCVTEGEIGTEGGGRLTVDTTKMRAYVNTWTSDAIEAHFTYLGGTAQESALASGAVRRQFGLKLRAQNACNLVYAMWRIEPESKIVVSIKKNPGQTTSSECGNRGYQNIKPRHSAPAPILQPGQAHVLSAELHGNSVRVAIDGNNVWEGDLGPDADGILGPVGVRSDNVRLAFDLKAGAPTGMHPDFRVACKSGPGVSD
jgi:hypothetical protein